MDPTEASGALDRILEHGISPDPVIRACIVVSATEVPVVRLLLPWPAARKGAQVLGVQGLLWMVGMLASLRVPPYVVEPAGLRVRNGGRGRRRRPWDGTAAARQRLRSLAGRATSRSTPEPSRWGRQPDDRRPR